MTRVVAGTQEVLAWGVHLGRHAPRLLWQMADMAVRSRVTVEGSRPQIVVATHHKALTVFLGRVMRCFAIASNRSVSRGLGHQLDYGADVLLDHHSQYDQGASCRPVVGLHVSRDPRDLTVSCAFYHQRARESWLHEVRDEFGGRTYQEYTNSLASMEERLLFELDHSAGRNIEAMCRWDRTRSEFAEVRYEDLVASDAAATFAKALSTLQLGEKEQCLLQDLFAFFSVGSPGAQGNQHLRNPASGQWREYFTPRVEARFKERFPDALSSLGYG